ncbi:helix-turn-helix domain-containing protein [Streptosporangium roseum]|uniref:helix-turn-helix domain-containing protein n=1 Tax=Streptosporangium roseum TaxID=2001 RepID=UPI0033226D76
MTRLLLTVDEAAEALAISRAKLYQLMASGAVVYVRIDRSRRIPVSALEAFVTALTELAEKEVAA